jgi:hypothetical protein
LAGRSGQAAMAKRRFVLLPRRWLVERSFAWAVRFRGLARDYEGLDTTLKGPTCSPSHALCSCAVHHKLSFCTHKPLLDCWTPK